MQQLQQLQAQALTKGTSSQSESLKAGTTSLTQLPDHKGGAEASLRFNDWLEITTTAMTDVSERSGQWWSAVLMVGRAAYGRWLSASHLERLTIQPEGMDNLCRDPWSRMNARACTMLLGAMPQELKGDMVAQQLTQKAPAMLFRLFVWFQPGGSAERQEVLKQLQSPQDYLKGDGAEAVLTEVRSWPRWLSRCKMMGMSPPDPLVMSRGLQALTAKTISASTDASFRTSMLRSTYRLDGQPSLEQVQGYQKHLQAELEGIVGAQRTTSSTTSTAGAALRVLDGVTSPTTPKGQRTKEKNQELCRYFTKASGCKRGDKCVYNHTMSGMDKDLRARKCLRCGSESHRAKDCLVGRTSQKPQSQGEKGTSSTTPTSATPTSPSLATMSTAASLSSGSQGTVQGTPWTLETLIQAAQQVIQKQAPTDGESSPEKTKAEIKVLSLCDVRVSAMDSSTTALLDSGATHCLRNAHDRDEWLQSEEVLVQLAGNNALTMRLSSGGSLLMPPRSCTASTTTSTTQGQTIVPLGELVKTLGYSLDWSQRGCFLVDPNGVSRSLGVSGGCPLLQEAEALALISRLEDRKREMLENATAVTQDIVEASEMMMVKSWKDYLVKYVATGGMEAGLRAVRDSPLLSELPGECVSGLAQANVIQDGWKVFEDIEYLSRPQRRRLWTAKRWVVHLYAGCPGHFQIFQLDEGDTVVIELDSQRNRGHDVTRSSTWRLLMWGAMQGRIETIIGGPPGRTSLGCLRKGSEEWDNKSLKAVARMLWLHAVAVEGRFLNAKGSDRGRPVAFMMEHPPTDKEAESLGQESRRRSVWETTMWRAFQEEYDMIEVTFDQRATGAQGSLPTTLGTNVYYLQGLQGEGGEATACEDAKDYSGVWSSGLTKAIVMALSTGRRRLEHLLDYHHVKRGIKGINSEQGRIIRDDAPGEQGQEDECDQIIGCTEYIGATETQVDGIKDYECSEYEPSLPDGDGEPTIGEEPLQGSDVKEEGSVRPDCEPPESTVLMFAKALKTNAGSDVKAALQDIILYLDSQGLPTYRFHADRGECFSHNLCGWLRDRHIKASWSEAGIPQGNGRAEAAVRWIKDKTRTLLLRSALPTALWPTAAETAAAQQRARVLEWKSKLLAPYGAPVLVKEKAFDAQGPRRRDRAFETRRDSMMSGSSEFIDMGEAWAGCLPEYPELGKMMARMVLDSCPEATFTSIMVSKDFNRGYHKDINNDANTRNYVIPVKVPSRGKVHYGQSYEMKEGIPIVLDPRCAHEVLPWTGTRINLIAYTPDGLGKLSYEDIKSLEDYGFPTPLSQLPEYFVSDKGTDRCLKQVEVQEEAMEFEDEEGSLSDEDWEMFVESESGQVKIGDSTPRQPSQQQPHIGKTEVVYTKDVEKILSELKEPLKVTYTVDPREALQHLPKWKDAIAKEVKGVSVAIQRLMPGTPERTAWFHKKGAQRLPTKLVYTIKPNDAADPLDQSTWYRRKVRLVVCGNMATSSFSDYYCEAAPTEALFDYVFTGLACIIATSKRTCNRRLTHSHSFILL
eukprot:s3987_g6.t1